MPAWSVLRSRLTLRFYLVGLAQMLVVAAGFTAILMTNGPPERTFFDHHFELAATYLGTGPGDRASVNERLSRAREAIALDIAVRDEEGELLAASDRWAATCAPDGHEEGLIPARHCLSRPVAFTDGTKGTATFVLLRPAPPRELKTRVVPLVLLVVAVFALVLARSLTRPLRRMSEAAKAFGKGDLSARANVSRADEIGDVARAFDEMAERVTDLLRAEKELLANVSHELRTPLTRIRIALDIAAEGDAEAARESLADIAGDLDELERIISDILTTARLDLSDGASSASGMPLRKQPLDVKDLLGQAASRFRAAHPDRPLRESFSESMPQVDGDPVLLRRVLDNLLENAHKYTDRPGEAIALTVRAVILSDDEGDETIRIDVEDRGIGISEEDLPKIFQPFFRADRSRTRKTGGLGLGLALAKRIVDAHGGHIEVTSRLHEGTRVRVYLPVLRPAPPSA